MGRNSKGLSGEQHKGIGGHEPP